MHWNAFVAYFAIASCVTHGDLEPFLESTETHIRTKEGSSAILTCIVTNMQQNRRVKWYTADGNTISINDKIYTSDRRMSILQPLPGTWSLRIQGVRQRDSGLYRCILDTEPVQTKNVNLHVQVPPRISASDHTSVGVGKHLELWCNVTGEPTPEVRWFKDNTPLLEHTSEHCVVESTSMRDKGAYECVAENGVTPSATANINVDILFPPNVTCLIERIGQFVNRQTKIECKVVANPEATVTWYHDATPLKQTWKYRIESFSEDGETRHSLSITTLERFDFGKYICFATNSEGSGSSATHVYEMQTRSTPSSTTSSSSTASTATSTFLIESTPTTKSVPTPSIHSSSNPQVSATYTYVITTYSSEQVAGQSNSASITIYRCPYVILTVALIWIESYHA